MAGTSIDMSKVKQLLQLKLKLDDPVLDKRMHPGNPAYTEEFLRLLPDFVEQLSRKHITRQIVWEDYKRMHPDGYERRTHCNLDAEITALLMPKVL